MKIYTTDYNNDKNIDCIDNYDIGHDPINNVTVTVDNGRIYIVVNGVEVYENTSLHSGCIEIVKE